MAHNIGDTLSRLDTYIATIKSEINKFNPYANINYVALTAYVKRFDDVM